MSKDNGNNVGVARRSVVKGAAWAAPVVAAAVAIPSVSASVVETVDLAPALSGPINLSLNVLGLPVASITALNTLTITNLGTVASTGTETATLVYNPSLLTINTLNLGVAVAGSEGNYVFTLPVIQPGASLTINLGTTLNSLLNLNLLNNLIAGGSQTMSSTVSGDTVTDNNTVSEIVGISIL
ncbi:hypothetical protein [Glutamicibacter mishrai]|uniref:Uncharacterized protein n=1 Tax=Glutamicibacter mishrai TaxID=1775880 RepID=A0A6H0SJE7_9MICC|nr:hypothetical protein [Glutamicibacter mishrai]QIV86465.1 hypothetical protein D3791_04595 [Glutamicibacter mishrai]